jgi:integrase
MPRKPAEPQHYTGVYASGRSHFQYKLRLPPDDTGVRHWEVRGGFLTARDAWQARERRQIELEERRAPLTRQTVRLLVDAYIQSITRSVDAASIRAYRSRAASYIDPFIGDKLVRDLTPQDMRAWIQQLATIGKTRKTTHRDTPAGLSVSTIRGARTLLAAAFNQAVDDDRLAKSPLTRAVRMPAERTVHPAQWSTEEIRTFLAAVDGTDDDAYWYLALFSQMRPGELAALRWGDIELERALVHIRRTRTIDVTGKHIIGDGAKTPASARTIPIPPNCVTLLRRHADRQQFNRNRYAGLWQEHGLVFPGRRGQLLGPSTMARRLTQICAVNSLTPLTPHKIRSVGLSLMAALGVDAATLSRRAGHTDSTFTMSVYVQPTDDMQRDAIARVADAIGRG